MGQEINGKVSLKMLPVINSTTVSNMIGSENNNLIRTSIIWIVWIFIIGLIIIQVR